MAKHLAEIYQAAIDEGCEALVGKKFPAPYVIVCNIGVAHTPQMLIGFLLSEAIVEALNMRVPTVKKLHIAYATGKLPPARDVVEFTGVLSSYLKQKVRQRIIALFTEKVGITTATAVALSAEVLERRDALIRFYNSIEEFEPDMLVPGHP